LRIAKNTLLFALGSFLVFCGLRIFLIPQAFPGQQELKVLLMNNLSKFEPLPVASYQFHSNSGSVIYVLGGDQNSLENRFKTASDLYKNGLANKILILNNEMVTEYSPLLARNLTSNEWAIRILIGLGVRNEDIEPVLIEKGSFGTFSEARSVSHIASNRGYKSLVLVSSEYHTMRAWECFSKSLKNRDVNLYIYGSNDFFDMQILLQEYLKLNVYRIFLL
jgi:uncharacterized SAM-binding protein YcdF (DUF218 family)